MTEAVIARGIIKKLKILEKMSSEIQDLFAFAENLKDDPAVKLWLGNLEDLANDMDNLLSGVEVEAIGRQFKEESFASISNNNKKVLKFIPTAIANATHNFKYDPVMSYKIDVIRTKLECLQRVKYDLMNVRRKNRQYETSLLVETRIVGRKHDKEVLLQELLGTDTCTTNISVLSIVGMGGIGKTTLAKILYEDSKVNDHFDFKAWVCVSDKFDAFSISREIFQSVSGESSRKFFSQDMLQEALADKLSGKRFLLVLDDVWNLTDDWECLQRCFVPGNKIIVTTQNTKIAAIMKSVQVYNLEGLSIEDSVSLLAQQALGGDSFELHQTLKSPGEGISKKCQGLPLALNFSGSLLRTKRDVRDWENLLHTEPWDWRDWQGESHILSSLKLSYNDLTTHIRKMFLYCSLFPRGYVFHKDELLLLSMAEGFLRQSDGNTSMESLGCEYFEELHSRSLFYHLPGEKSRYKIHGLYYDLAKSLAKQYVYMLDDGMDVNGNNESLEMLRHFSFVRQQFGVYSKFEALRGARRLRTFIAIPADVDDRRSFHISEKVLLELLPQLKYLRVLSLSNYSITMVPKSIGSLKHMRYLNFSKTSITGLPEQVCNLYNLQVLLLHGCEKLVSLPRSFAKLVNLRHLDISDTPMLKKLPSGIGGMTSLQFISKVIIEESNGFKISKLKGMQELRGQISIEGLNKVKDARQGERAGLQHKKDLEDLVMEWSDVFVDRDEENEYKVFDKLKPHDELKGLKILFYGGKQFPSWVGDSSYSRLTQLSLRGCQNCTCLPMLGFLESLKKLCVEGMPKVVTIASELFPSRSLEVLEFENMQSWEKWSVNNGDNDGSTGSFPHLFEISIVDCPKLAHVSVEKIPSLRVIHIERCSEVVLRSMIGASSSIFSLKMDNINGLTPLHGEVLQHLGVVKHLCITKCHSVEYLWESSEAPKYLANLQKLEVSSCKKLASVGKTADDIGITTENLTEVFLTNCEKLQSYKCPQSIKRLVIHNCRSIEELSFPPGHNLPLILDIQRCHSLKEFWPDESSLSSVNSLEMDNLPNLRSFPEVCFESLAKLIIRGCDNIDTIPEKVFDNIPLCHLEIISCKNMKSFPHNLLPSLPLLKELLITNCPLMGSFPCGSWPPNLSILRIGRLGKPMSKWGPQAFPNTLVNLCLLGENSGVDSFARVAFILPASLTFLEIIGFRLLESLSEGLKDLTSLEQLVIESCPNLEDLPEKLLPSLSSLKVYSSLKLQERCRRKKGGYQRLISHIHEVDV